MKVQHADLGHIGFNFGADNLDIRFGAVVVDFPGEGYGKFSIFQETGKYIE